MRYALTDMVCSEYCDQVRRGEIYQTVLAYAPLDGKERVCGILFSKPSRANKTLTFR